MRVRMNKTKAFGIRDIFRGLKHAPKILKLLYLSNRFKLIIIVLLNIILGFVPIINLLITERLINSLATGNQDLLIKNFIFYISTGILGSILNLWQNHFNNLFRRLISYDLEIKINQKATELSLSHFEDSEVYDKLQRAQSEVAFRPYEIFTAILTLINSLTTLISSALILYFWKRWIAIVLIFVPFISTYKLLHQGQKEYYVERNRSEARRKSWYYSYLLTKDINIKEIKLYNLNDYFINKNKSIYQDFYQVDQKLSRKRTFLNLVFEMINHLIVMFVVFLIIRNVFQGKLLIGTFVSYLRAVNLTHHNSVQVLNQIFLLYQNNLYISNLFEFFSIKVSEPNKSAEHEITSIEKIAFVNVYFKYPGSQEYALENISFTINKAENIAIVGENGSGKTTIIKLLTGLYEVEAGKIYLNDLDIKVIKKQSLQKNIGILLQDFVKYQLSLRENVGLGELDLINSDKALINALDKSGGASILSSLTNGLNQQLGCWFDNGTELSTGQWQKIALARAFLRDASLYILDEPSSALDPLSEKELFQKFKVLVAGKMGIYISHRFSTVKFASKIIVLKKGKIIEVGNHFELMKQNKYYAEIYNVQKEPYLDD